MSICSCAALTALAPIPLTFVREFLKPSAAAYRKKKHRSETQLRAAMQLKKPNGFFSKIVLHTTRRSRCFIGRSPAIS